MNFNISPILNIMKLFVLLPQQVVKIICECDDGLV